MHNSSVGNSISSSLDYHNRWRTLESPARDFFVPVNALRRKMRALNLGIHFYGESSARPLRKLTWIPRREVQKGGGENALSFGDSRTEMAKRYSSSLVMSVTGPPSKIWLKAE